MCQYRTAGRYATPTGQDVIRLAAVELAWSALREARDLYGNEGATAATTAASSTAEGGGSSSSSSSSSGPQRPQLFAVAAQAAQAAARFKERLLGGLGGEGEGQGNGEDVEGDGEEGEVQVELSAGLLNRAAAAADAGLALLAERWQVGSGVQGLRVYR